MNHIISDVKNKSKNLILIFKYYLIPYNYLIYGTINFITLTFVIYYFYLKL